MIKMKISSARLLAATGATLALVIASSAAVTAAPRNDDRLPGPWGRGGPGVDRMMDGFEQGLWDLGGMRGRLGAALDEYSRREVTLVKTDGTTTISRVDNGTVSGTSEAAIDYTLTSGDAATVAVDEDTQVVGFTEETVTQRGWNRTRLVPSEMSLADVEAGADVVIWATSDDGESFLAQRVVVQPAEDTEVADETEATEDDAAAATEGSDNATEDSAAAPVVDA